METPDSGASQHPAPRLLNLVPQPDTGYIIGRDAEVERTRLLLQSGAPVVLVNGVGGIGKTTVALKYLAQYEAEYAHLAWVTVNSTLAEALVFDPLVESLGLKPEFQALPPDQLHETGLRRVLQRLSELPGCLLVLDNANDLADLLDRQALLNSCRAHLLITSRNTPQGWRSVPVESLPAEQARVLFRRYYLYEAPAPGPLDELLALLGHHTLLVELSAKAAQASRLPFNNLLDRIRAGYIHDEALNKRSVDTGQSGLSQETRWKIARVEAYADLIFSEIANLFDAEKEQLRPFILLPPAEWYDEASLQLIFEALDLALQPDLLDRLVEKGWLLREPDPAKLLGYKMHPLVQDVAFRKLDVTAEWAGPVLQYVAGKINYDNTDPAHDLAQKNEARPWAEYLERRFWVARTEEMSHLLDRLATLNKQYGHYAVASSLSERALEVTMELLGPHHITVAVLQSNLGNIYCDLGEYEKARDLHEAALSSSLKNFGPKGSVLSPFQSNLAIVYGKLGQYDKARDLLEVALASDMESLGPVHPNIALYQSILGVVYSKLGQYDKARDLLKLALASDLKNFGPDHPNVATRYNNLALVDLSTGRYTEAMDGFEKTLAILRLNFGEQHPYIEITLQSIARVRKKMGEG